METKQLSYYQPYLTEQQKLDFPEQLQTPYIKVANQLANVLFQKDATTNKVIMIETGMDEISPNQIHKRLEEEVIELVKIKTLGVDPESEEGKRIRTLTKPLLSAFVTDTHIRSIKSDSYLGFVGLSLDFAKNPDLIQELCIQTGFGGSIDYQTNLRVPAYAIPALRMVENIKQVCERGNLDVNLPSIRYIFAPNTAIAINGSRMSAQQVLNNAKCGRNYLVNYINRFHSLVSEQVIVDVDSPWTDHDETTKVIHRSFSRLLLEANDKVVQNALEKLRELGMRHGDKEGQRLACDYTSVHSFIFRDATEHPQDNFFNISRKPLLTISIGGRPERFFNVARSFIRRQFNIQYLLDSCPDNISEQLDVYRDSLINSRKNYGDVLDINIIHEGDKPIVSIPAITFVGATPVYYATEYDLPFEAMTKKPTELLAIMGKSINEDKSGQEKSLAKDRLKIVTHDIEVIIKDTGGEDKFIDFISNQ